MKGRRGSGLRRAAVVLWVLLACAACGPPEGVTPSTDWDPASPRAVRVVSLSPLASRFLLLLEAQDRLVGVDRESARLPGLEELDRVRGAHLQVLEVTSAGGAKSGPLAHHRVAEVESQARALRSRALEAG